MTDQFKFGMLPNRQRNVVLHWTPAEHAIAEAVRVIEGMGCHVLLTRAVSLLSDAQDAVADFVEGKERQPDIERAQALEEDLKSLKEALESADGKSFPAKTIAGADARQRYLEMCDNLTNARLDAEHYRRGVANWLAKSKNAGRPCGGCKGCGDDSLTGGNFCVGSGWIAPRDYIKDQGEDSLTVEKERKMLGDQNLRLLESVRVINEELFGTKAELASSKAEIDRLKASLASANAGLSEASGKIADLQARAPDATQYEPVLLLVLNESAAPVTRGELVEALREAMGKQEKT